MSRLFSSKVTRSILQLLLVIAIPLAVVGGGWYWWLGTHPLHTTLEGCGSVRDRDARRNCYTKALDTLIREKGLDKSAPIIQGYSEELGSLSEQCHLSMHPLGVRAGVHAALKGGKIPGFGTDFPVGWCTEGWVHGFMIGYLSKTTDIRQARETATKLCVGKHANACLHAFGHHFATQYRSDIDTAVDSCMNIQPLSINKSVTDPRPHCFYGMFMQYAMDDVAEGDHPKLDNCRKSWPALAIEYCYRYLPSRAVTLDPDKQDGNLERVCTAAPKGPYRTGCLESAQVSTSGDAPLIAFNKRDGKAVADDGSVA